MSDDGRCEAQAMDFARFGNMDDPVPICNEAAAVDVDGYRLCHGCAEALAGLRSAAHAVARTRASQN